MHQVVEHEVRDAEAVLDRLHAERGPEMRLAHARGPEEQHVRSVAQILARRQGLNLPTIGLGLEAPVEVLEGLPRRVSAIV